MANRYLSAEKSANKFRAEHPHSAQNSEFYGPMVSDARESFERAVDEYNKRA